MMMTDTDRPTPIAPRQLAPRHQLKLPFIVAAQGARWNEKTQESDRAVTMFVVTGLHPFDTVVQTHFLVSLKLEFLLPILAYMVNL